MTQPDTNTQDKEPALIDKELDEINRELMERLSIPFGLYSPSERRHLTEQLYYSAALPEIHRLRNIIDKLVRP